MFTCQSCSAAVRNPDAQSAGQHPVTAQVLTKDHKPEDPEENKLIHSLGEKIAEHYWDTDRALP